jgi:hypothetical protein
VHSLEEYRFRLFDRLAPARAVSELIGLDRATGFAVVNTALVLFGLWCWAWPLQRRWRRAAAFAWGWALVEIANGTAHIGLAVLARGYFPGLFTAPLLLAAGFILIARLHTGRPRAGVE